MISFYREKNVPFGGPDGGSGGHGGHVLFEASKKVKDLGRIPRLVCAHRGRPGMDKCADGRSASHWYVEVPLNTIVKLPSGEIVHEMRKDGEVFIAARGGAGGHGNHFYLSNQVRAPQKAEIGGKGEEVRPLLKTKIKDFRRNTC